MGIVQTAHNPTGPANYAFFANPVTPGNIVIMISAARSPAGGATPWNPGGAVWHECGYAYNTVPEEFRAAWIAYWDVISPITIGANDPTGRRFDSWRTDDRIAVIELEGGAFAGPAVAATNHAASTLIDCGGPVTIPLAGSVLVVGVAEYGPHNYVTYPNADALPGVVELMDEGNGPHAWGGYRVESGTGTFTVGATVPSPYNFAGVTAMFTIGPPPVLEPDELLDIDYPVIRGTAWIGVGSTSTTPDGADEPDHDASQIHIADAGGHFEATDVEGALHELASPSADLSLHLLDLSDAHDASAVSFVPGGGVAASQLQLAIAEVSLNIDSHLLGAAHSALRIPFAPAAGLMSTNVQDAILEAAALGGASGIGGAGTLMPVMATSPNIVTTDGTPVWVILVTPDGAPVMASGEPMGGAWAWGDWSETWYSPLAA